MFSKILGVWLIIDSVASIVMDWQKRKYRFLANGCRVLRAVVGLTFIMFL